MSSVPSGGLSIDLSGQVALVTGASRGIGRAIAESLGGWGARVACVARNADKLDEVVQAIRDAGGEAEPFAADVGDRASVDSTVEAVLNQWEAIHILVNNAGITQDGLVLRMTDEQWDDVIRTNLTGTFFFTRAVARTMLGQRYGRIINLSSVGGVTGNAGQANYAASKAGVLGFTKSVARELATRGVTANVVAPGFITTDMTDALPEQLREQVKRQIPIRRFGEPGEIAQVVGFLASRQASYLTGQVIHVDGGMVM
jgi:3-oxoacyl-[acyl-carrier protein] reductase